MESMAIIMEFIRNKHNGTKSMIKQKLLLEQESKEKYLRTLSVLFIRRIDHYLLFDFFNLYLCENENV